MVGGYFCEVPKPLKPFCQLPYQTVEGLKICGKLLVLCVITKCFITKCFITAFSLPEIIKVLVSHEDVKLIAIYCEI